MIYILTGPVRTGKTTALLDWSAKNQYINGLLCPDDASGKRYFLSIGNREEFILEVNNKTVQDDLIVEVGPFRFLKQAFTRANHFLISTAEKAHYNYLVIDELGKLELRNTGLHKAATTLIPKHEFDPRKHLILVVRDTLLEAVIAHYNIRVFQQLTKNDLAKLGEVGSKVGISDL